MDAPQTSVSEETAAKTPSERRNNAPWMLFRSSPSDGGGLLSLVTYVQQLSTVGGAPPATLAQYGGHVQVPYFARYAFYVAESGRNKRAP